MKKILTFLFLVLSTMPAWCATNYCNDANMAAAWKFNEASGSIADCTSNANSGTVVGTITQNVTGKYSQGVDFTNVNNSYVSVAAAASNNGIIKLSTGLWVKVHSAGHTDGIFCNGSASAIIGKNDGASGWQVCLSGTTPGKILFVNKYAGGISRYQTTSGVVPYDNTWHHIDVVVDQTSAANTPVMYYDGVSQAVSNVNSSSSTLNSDSGIAVGIGVDGVANQVAEADMVMDEPYIYKTNLLTSADVTSIMNNGLDGSQGTVSHQYFIGNKFFANNKVVFQ